MNQRTYVSPEIQLKTVAREDILNTSGEVADLANEACIDSSPLFNFL